MRVVEELDFHWLIGILEGEGTFLAPSPSAPGQPVVRLSMTDRETVERVAALWARAVMTRTRRRDRHKTSFTTTLKGSPAAAFMRAVAPHMGVARQAQIDAALASWQGKPIRWRSTAIACAEEACGRRAAKRGLCKRHYHSWWKSTRRRTMPKHAPVAPPSIAPIIETARCGEACELAWLAGLLEGEATFGVSRGRVHRYPTIAVQMCDEDVIARVARSLNAHRIYRREFDHDRWSPTFHVSVVGASAAAWMRRLRPMMGPRRAAAIDAALAAYHPIRLVDAPATCVVTGCAEPTRSRGLCHKHYMSWSRDLAKSRTPRVTPLR